METVEMNDDRELLELAAKAAGHDVWTDIDGNLYTGEPERRWNPLADDGDALRLAVKLNLVVSVNHQSDMRGDEFVAVLWDGPCEAVKSLFDDQDDPYAATRRAIVRVAAEIGKTVA